MKKLSTATVLLLAIFLLTASQTSAQNPDFGTVSGSVVDQDSSDPIENAMVAVINPNGPPHPVAQAHTDEAGNYTVDVPYGEYLIVSHAYQYYPEFWEEASSPQDATPVLVDESNNPTGINFTLSHHDGPEDYSTVAGTVYEASTNNPIENSLIELRLVNDHHFHLRTHTNENGEYIFDFVPYGEYFAVKVLCPRSTILQ